MYKIFKAQKVMAGIYTVTAVAVFIFALTFMTEYKDLFGLKLKQNSQISFFHDSVLQTFNRQIFVFALVGILVILCSFLLEVFSKVPDRFALMVMGALLIACCGGAVYAIFNIQAIEAFYRTLDFQYLKLEGMADYKPHFATFRIGTGIYILQLAVCAGYMAAMVISHVQFIKNRKKGRMEHE